MKRGVAVVGLAAFEAVALIAVATVQFVAGGSSSTAGATWGFAAAAGLVPLSLCVYPLVGGFVVARRRGNPIGWLLLVSGLSWLLSFSLIPLKALNVHITMEGSAAPLLYVWQLAWWVPALGLTMTLMLQLFPNGRLVSKRWRKVAVGSAVALVVGMAVATVGPDPGDVGTIANPYASPTLRPVGQALGPLLLLFPLTIIISVASLVVRYRRSAIDQREQIKWVAFAGAAVAAIYAVALIASIATERPDGSVPAPVSVIQELTLLGYAAVPAAIGIAILRYRLYDIDRIISRTISYALVTAVLGGMFVLFVLVPSLFLGGNRPDWVVAAATLLVAALFRPVRWRIQSAVDHRFNRARYDAEHTIEVFTARLREQIDIDSLGAELRSVVSRTMQPATTSLWLRPGRSS
jgi:hypothetical protein